jgi:hypothetical protein
MSRRALEKNSRAAGILGLAAIVVPAVIACGAKAERPPNEPDCSVEDAYEFTTPLIDAEMGSPNHPVTWFGADDNTPGCLANPPGVVDGVPLGDVTKDDAGLPVIEASLCTVQENTDIGTKTDTGPSYLFATLKDAAHLSIPGTPQYDKTTTTPVHRSLVFHSEGCTFWGSNASHSLPSAPLAPGSNGGYLPGACNAYYQGTLEQPTGYWDGSQFEGIAFWARTPGASNHSVTLSLNNADTAVQSSTGYCYLPRVPASRCTPAPTDATAGLGAAVVDYQSGTATAGGVPTRIPEQGECGNAFQRVLTTTPDWQFYTLPFDTFYQLPYPNRIASGFDSSTLLQIAVVFPREVRTELWIANFRFYRRKGAAANPVTDAGSN